MDSTTEGITLALIGGYFLLVMGMAKLFARRIEGLQDFYLAGRSLGVWPVAISFVATWFGAGSTMGSINAFHNHGLSGLWYIIIPSFLSVLLITTVLAKRVAKQNTLSQPEAVETHYGKAGRLLLSVIILVCIINFLASQMVAAGMILQGVFGFDFTLAVLLCTMIVLTYSMVGGYFAVVVTDYAQLGMIALSLLMLTGFSIATLFQPDWSSNFQSSIQTFLHQQPPTFWRLTGSGETPLLQYLCLTLTFVLAWSIAPEMWQRMTSLKDERLAARTGWLALLMLGSLFVMVSLIGLLSPLQVSESKFVLVDLALKLPHPILTALVLIGFLSAVTSTMDSSLNVGSLTLTRDLFQGFLNPSASEASLLWTGRLATVLIAIPAIVIAVAFQDIIHVLWMSADVYASAMFFPVLGILYLNTPTRLSGILAMVFGFSVVIFSALVQYGWINLPFPWPQAPYSTLLGITASGVGFALGHCTQGTQAKRVEAVEANAFINSTNLSQAQQV